MLSGSLDNTLRPWSLASGDCLQATYAALPQGFASFRGDELVAAHRPVWRYLAYHAPDKNGVIMPYELQAGLNEEPLGWLSDE